MGRLMNGVSWHMVPCGLKVSVWSGTARIVTILDEEKMGDASSDEKSTSFAVWL